jgi:hypothetical protein
MLNPEIIGKIDPRTLEVARQRVRFAEAVENLNSNVVEKAKANLEFTEILNKKEINHEEEEILHKVFERRLWFRKMNQLRANDRIITIMSPGESFLSIKNLNDNILGQQKTDILIAKRAEYVSQAFKDYVQAFVGHEFDLNIFELEQNYKYGVYRLPQELAEKIDFDDLLKSVSEQVEDKMIAEINDLIEESLRAAMKRDDQDDIEDINQFMQALQTYGFKVGGGVSTVDSRADVKSKVLALANSLQDSKIRNLRLVEDGQTDRNFVSELNQLRDMLRSHGNRIVNSEEQEFEIFNSDRSFNRELLLAIRKNLFQPKDAHEKETLSLINDYVERLNVIDFIKPFELKKIGEFEKELEYLKKLGSFFSTSNQADLQSLQNKLKRNEKDERFIANEMFDYEAIRIDNCVYLSLDVLDIGVDQLLHYEKLLQKVEIGQATLEDVSLTADEFITQRLQEVRDMAYDIITNYKNGRLLNKDGLAITLIGGDEICFVIDNDKISDDDLDELMFKIKEDTNVRVAKTVIVQSERHSMNKSNEESRLKDHLLALSRSEIGINTIKEIESAVKRIKFKLNRVINSTRQRAQTAALEDMISEVEALGLDSLVAIEDSDGEMKFKFKVNDESYRLKDIFDKLTSIEEAIR